LFTEGKGVVDMTKNAGKIMKKTVKNIGKVK